ncbi:hypothetical protein ATY41_03820 [Leifsonia xyli subsp. xyli]|uniref:Uncharacterized protein n=2 Tax=Leifsonia xyli subsp. xyli TaxID=59736 RepID=Q6AGY9_LEIXX|nr:hypothetical protein [Leifsonia xyli]AAT88356.1 hypothetical protein Lxx03400 [Leifsonia xyli subsp. xyli str. CTCB07]ODA89789.1 hypothetical protein ATY41_03820 [Leifsonia xyli subsp. xyli]
MTGQAIMGQLPAGAFPAGFPAVLDPESFTVDRIPYDGGLTITMNATGPSEDHTTAELPPEHGRRLAAPGTIERAS